MCLMRKLENISTGPLKMLTVIPDLIDLFSVENHWDKLSKKDIGKI